MCTFAPAMAKDKLARFAAIKTFSNVLEHHYQASFPMKGHWHRDFFKNDHPIVLELGCGKGEENTPWVCHACFRRKTSSVWTSKATACS